MGENLCHLPVVTVRLLCAQTHGWVLWGCITEAGAVLTPPAVSRVGIKIWHPQRSSTDTSWAWGQRKCLSTPLSTLPFPLLHNHAPLSPSSTPHNFSCVSSFAFFIFPSPSFYSAKHPSSASAQVPLSLPPFPCVPFLSSHLQILSSDTTLIFCQLFFPPWTSVSVAQ